MFRRLVVLFVASLGAAPAPAQTPTSAGFPLTLEQAEQRALARNPQIAEAQLATAAADYAVAERRAAYSPTFIASLTERAQTSPATTQLAGGRQQVTTDASSYAAGVSQLLPWGGGRIQVDFSGNRMETSNVFSTYNPSFSSVLSLSVTQPLLRGLQDDTTRAAITQAVIGRGVADEALRRQMATTLAAVRRAYWELVYAADALETARRSEQLAERQRADNRRRAELGTVAAIDVLESEAEVAARRQAVVQADGVWRTAQVALRQLLASGTSDPIWSTTLVPVDRPAPGTRAIDLLAATARALAGRTDLNTARRERQGADTTVRLLDDERKPSIDLVAGYSLSGIGGTQILRQSGTLGSDVVGSLPGGYLDVLRSIGGLDYPTWSVGLNVSIPLGTRATDAAYARGQVERRRADARIEALQLQVAAEVARAGERVRSAEQQIEAARLARELAEKRVEAEDARRAAGLSTTFLVLQAQRDLGTAQTNELRAQLDYRVALVDFDLAQQAP